MEEKPCNFSRIILKENVKLERNMPDVVKIVSKIIETEVVSVSMKNTIGVFLKNGREIATKNLVLEIKVKEKIMYSSSCSEDNLHIIERESYQVEYISIPSKMEGVDSQVFIDKKKFKVDINVEEVYINPIDKRNMYISIFMVVIFKILPTYVIAHCVSEKDKKNELYLMYESGKECANVSSKERKINVTNIEWSKNGKDIIFIDSKKNRDSLCSIDSDNFTVKYLVKDKLEYISYFSLDKSGENVLLSGRLREEENIYMLNIFSLKYEKITKDKAGIINYNPKFLADRNNIVFLRNICGVVNVWSLNLENYSMKKLTHCGYVKDFRCSENGDFLVYRHGNSITKDKIYCLDLYNLRNEELELCQSSDKLNNLTISPDDRYLAYVARNEYYDYIFLYDIKNKKKKLLIKVKVV